MLAALMLPLMAMPFADPAAQARPAPPLPAEVRSILSDSGFDGEAIDRILAGSIETVYPERASDKELAAAGAVLVKASLRAVVEAVRSDRRAEENEHVLGSRRLQFSEDGRLETAPEVVFSAAEDEEVVKLLEIEPGSAFNLAAFEIRRLATIGRSHRADTIDSKTRAAMAQAYADILRRRLEDYRARGLDGVNRYQRDDDEFADPAEELRQALAADRGLLKRWPAITASLQASPAPSPESPVEHQYLLQNLDVEDRPTSVLAHRVFLPSPDAAVLLERQLYVGHSYNSAQWIRICLAVPEGTIVLDVRRTSTDRVDGLATSLTHRVGRRALRSAVVDELRSIRANVDSP